MLLLSNYFSNSIFLSDEVWIFVGWAVLLIWLDCCLYRCWEKCGRWGRHFKVSCQQTSVPYCRRSLTTSLPPIVSGRSAETTSSYFVSILQLLSIHEFILHLCHVNALHTSHQPNVSFLLLFPHFSWSFPLTICFDLQLLYLILNLPPLPCSCVIHYIDSILISWHFSMTMWM